MKNGKRLTIVDLPNTRKQIEENNKLGNRISRAWRNFLNGFFQPSKPLTMREAEIIGTSCFVIIVSVMYMLLWV